MNKKGFTLIELISVLIILTVIAALIMPSIIKYLDRNRQKSSESVEQLLINNLELYNTDNEDDLWDENTKCINVDIEDLMKSNQDINLGECLLSNEGALTIKKDDDGYKYYANITCGKDLESMSTNKYVLAFANTVYYKSTNIYNCN